MASARHQPRSIPSFTSTTTTSKPQQPPLSLSRRLLFPSLPLTTPDPPPLLTSPGVPSDLNAELYDFIALALRAFVNPWWTKITRYDKEFLPEITRVLTELVRVLEARLVNTDLSPLIFRDIPDLVTQHYHDYRNAAAKLSTSYAAGGAVSLPQLFHQLQPHIAVSPDGHIEEVYLRQVVDHILKTCLPPEDYKPECERLIVREIVLKVLLQDVVPKITQPWFIHKTLLDLLGPVSDKPESQPSSTSTPATSNFSYTSPAPTSPLSFHNLLISFLSAVQIISGTCLALIHAYKQTLSTIKLVNQSANTHTVQPSQAQASSSTLTGLVSDHSPSRSPSASSASSTQLPSTPLSQIHPQPPPSLISPVFDYARPSLAMLTEVFSTSDRFSSAAILNSVYMLSAFLTTFLDRLLPYVLYTHALSSTSITEIVCLGKRTLFPNGYPAPSPPEPSLEEQVAIREALVRTMQAKMPVLLTPLLLGPSPSVVLNGVLDPLSSPACNTHLVMLLLDVILLTVFPEIAIESAGTTNAEGIEREVKPLSSVLVSSAMSRSVSITPPGSIQP